MFGLGTEKSWVPAGTCLFHRNLGIVTFHRVENADASPLRSAHLQLRISFRVAVIDSTVPKGRAFVR